MDTQEVNVEEESTFVQAAILIVYNWETLCSRCGAHTHFDWETHEFQLGYQQTEPKQKGCGARFIAVCSPYGNDAISDIRTDLARIEYALASKHLSVATDD